MKRIVSLLLVCTLLFSFSSLAFAEDGSKKYETAIVYEGIQTDYSISVPAEIKPGETKQVSVSGYWPTDMVVNVSVPEKVELVSTSNSEDKIDLTVGFNSISQFGKGSIPVSVTEDLTIEGVTDRLFGTYKGYIVYDVTINESSEEDSNEGLTLTVDAPNRSDFNFAWVDDSKQELILTRYTGTESNLVIPAYVEGWANTEGVKPVVNITRITSGSSVIINETAAQTVVLPNTLTSIGAGAFYFRKNLESINIPDSVTSIGDSAFSGCSSLTGDLVIPDSVTSIDIRAFFGCSGLTSITIPNTVTSIGVTAFSGCSGLTSVTIPNSVKTIGTKTFYGCTSLKTLVVPTSVVSIDTEAFTSVGTLYYNGKATGGTTSPKNWGATTWSKTYPEGYTAEGVPEVN